MIKTCGMQKREMVSFSEITELTEMLLEIVTELKKLIPATIAYSKINELQTSVQARTLPSALPFRLRMKFSTAELSLIQKLQIACLTW